ncbi:MAG: hypothetical protein D6763_08740 [Alphaproteobacteria bacterium]|nr:MAG: hypothetical protein D6763_08740 [Alphaproteobacteria bacterium]
MGAFALVIGGHKKREQVARDALSKRGFSVNDRLAVGSNILLLAPSLVAPEPNLIRRGADFAAASGTLFYKGLYGERALAALLDEDRPPARDDISGCGVFLVARGGVLRLFTDPLGTYKVYRDTADTIWSDSFLAVAQTLTAPAINPQGVYEYVFQGATYGNETVLDRVQLVDSKSIHEIGDRVHSTPWPGGIEPAINQAPLEHHVDTLTELLRERYGAIATAFGDRVDTALSGGYDSRLTLALLLDQGVTPHLHVYGAPDDPDVIVARTVCAGEGLSISHEDKSALGDDSPDGVTAAVKQQFLAFDGWPPDGIIGNGSDLATRRARCHNGVLALNGGGGEIFRNFFYLIDRPFTVRQILWTFYSRFEPRWCGEAFDESAYYTRMGEKISAIFTRPRDRLTRAEVEYIYPAFRGRFWTGRNTAINTHLGPALTPFLDHALVRAAVGVPLAYKNHGILEAAMIEAISPALARYASDYGHSFCGAVPLRRKLRDWMTYVRPPALRRFSYRFKTRLQPPGLKRFLQPNYRRSYLPNGIAYMDRFFHLDRVTDPAQMNRILTLEFLFQDLNARF